MRLLLTFIFLCVSTLGFAQGSNYNSSNVQAALSANVPHLPAITRYDGTGKKFYGEKYVYKLQCESNIDNWIDNYPAEVTAYKAIISNYVSNTNVQTLTPAEQDVYYDLSTQWIMVRHHKGW